jgi:hypothetical protein
LEKVDGWALPSDGGVTADSLKGIIQGMTARGDLKAPIDVESLLRDSAVKKAFQDLLKRPELQPAYERVKLVVAKYGF